MWSPLQGFVVKVCRMFDIAVISAATSLAQFFGLLQVLHPTQAHLRLVINIGDGRTDRPLVTGCT
jgi:hypothetical protein